MCQEQCERLLIHDIGGLSENDDYDVCRNIWKDKKNMYKYYEASGFQKEEILKHSFGYMLSDRATEVIIAGPAW